MNWRASPEYANSKLFYDRVYKREVKSTGRHTKNLCEVSVVLDRHTFASAPINHVYWAHKETLDSIVFES